MSDLPNQGMNVEGLQKLFAQLLKADREVRAACLKAVWTGVNDIATRAKEILTENQHVVTGDLRRSIKGKAKFVEKDVIEGEVGTGVLYAPYIEALPDGGFLYPAYNELLPVIQKEIREKITEALKL